MNWSDMVVIGIILAFAIFGFLNGFIYSIFRLASFFVSIIVSIKFYPVVAEFLMKTEMYTGIKQSIFKGLMQQAQSPEVNGQVKEAGAKAIIENLHLPAFMEDTVKTSLPDAASLVNVDKVMDLLSDKLATFAIEIISLVLLYIALRIALVFARVILQGIAKLPVFKQCDKFGGFALGAVEGLLTVYIILAVVMLFNTAPQFKELFVAMESSTVAQYLYQNNFIISWMFPT